MQDTWPATAPTDDPAALEAAIQQMFSEMDRIDERIRRHRQETEGLKVETRAMLDSLRASQLHA
jgi:aspartate aminotransferase-like enzyme